MVSQQLKTFIQVADRGSLSKAAEDLYVTPASIMKQMNALENRLGVTLLKRTNQGIKLTEAGKSIYKAAKKIIAEAENAVLKAKTIEQNAIKTIRIGSSFLNPGSVLIDLWNKLSPNSSAYKFRIIPYSDDHEHILSVIASLGTDMDFLVGVFGSQQMLSISNFYEIGRYHLCVAVPGKHRLASKSMLSLADLHGEHLVIVKSGDSLHLDNLREILKMTHPQIVFEDADYFYDMDTFNACEMEGSLLLTLDAWASIHPSLVTLPVDWEYTVPYGLLFSKNLSETAADFLEVMKKGLQNFYQNS